MVRFILLIVFVLLGLTLVPALDGVAAGAAQTLWLLTMSVVACGVGVFVIRYPTPGLGDPLLLFAAVFTAYSASILAEMAVQATGGSRYFFFITGYFYTADFAHAGAASALAGAGLLLAALVAPARSAEASKPPGDEEDRALLQAMFALGFTAVAATMLLIVTNVFVTTGVAEFLAAARTGGERFNYSTVFGVGIPTTAFMIGGFAAMLVPLLRLHSRPPRLAFAALLAAFVLFNFVQGNRHLVLYVAIMSLGAYATLRAHSRIHLGMVVMLAAGGYAFFAYVASIRALLPRVFSGQAALADLAATSRSFSSEWMLPSRNEFAGPYLTLLDTLAYPQPPQHGMTYWHALLAILPTRFYPGVKPLSLGSAFAADTAFRIRSFAGSGFGFSPVAEAFDNFGYWGIPAVFFMLGVVLLGLGRLRSKGYAGLLVYLVALAQVVNTNRFSLDGTLQELAFSILSVLLLLAAARTVVRLGARHLRPGFDNPQIALAARNHRVQG